MSRSDRITILRSVAALSHHHRNVLLNERRYRRRVRSRQRVLKDIRELRATVIDAINADEPPADCPLRVAL